MCSYPHCMQLYGGCGQGCTDAMTKRKPKMKQADELLDKAEASVIRQRHKILRMKKLLRDLHPHVSALSVTDEAPEFKTLLKRVEEFI